MTTSTAYCSLYSLFSSLSKSVELKITSLEEATSLMKKRCEEEGMSLTQFATYLQKRVA